MLWPEKNSYKEFDNEKNSCGSKIPLPPPITFLMVRPLGHLRQIPENRWNFETGEKYESIF